ncbi:IS21 family transposase ISBf1 [bioreactor metagenome]|uniref:IS21 family transposase ISBf1 n=1 Tax=bioreactor metagenome TaxID=1076179 RepID=A0A645A5N3_9ZZZZ
MSQYIHLIKKQAVRLRLSCLGNNISTLIREAEENALSYDELIHHLLAFEIRERDDKQRQLRMKIAKLPLNHDLDAYDFRESPGISPAQLNQLRQLNWLENCYNILLNGPSGTGKTFLSAGLAYDALQRGYKVCFRNITDILSTLRLMELTPTAQKEYKRLTGAQLIIIDDLMSLPVEREDGNRFFVFINRMYEQTSFIITTNKSPSQWAQSLGDEVLATALLDRLLYKCQLIQLKGKSYRMQHRTNIFEE